MPEARLQRKITAFLDVFGLTDDQHAPMSAYSKGMRQKILIAAALLHDPQILVLDEPNSGLDVTTSLVLRSLVRALAAEGRMVIYCSHVLEIVEQIATDVLILQEGRVAAHGSVNELRRMMASPTLEQVFRRLVVTTDVDGLVRTLMNVMQA
jgi:ABC-2 type transport system ATP-binding protein